jgi:hypothetical protein
VTPKDKRILRLIVCAVLTQVAVGYLCGCDQVAMGCPSAHDLVGTYRLTKKSQDFLKRRKDYALVPTCEIELGPDSAIVIRNLPDCAGNGFGTSGNRYLSGGGRWELAKAFLGYEIHSDIKKGGTLASGPWVVIRGWKPRYELEVVVGDPDSGESLRYARQN